MIGLLEWLLRLKQVRLSGPDPVSLRLMTPPDTWALAAGLVLAAALVGVSYALESARGRVRAFLACCRLGALLWVMGLLSRPSLVVSRNHADPSVVAVVMDRSASMALSDPKSPARSGSRWTSAVTALTRPDGLLERLAAKHRARVWTFAERAEALEPAGELAAQRTALAECQPSGSATDLPGALARVLEQTRGSRLSAIIVASDGRQTQPGALESLLAEARERRVAIHTIRLGSSRPPRDVSLARVSADEDVFVGEPAEIRVGVTSTGLSDATPVTLAVRREEENGAALAQRAVTLGGATPSAETVARVRPTRAGTLRMRVEATPLPDEEVVENNRETVSLRVHDKKIRVLYVESEPRFEYRFLKNALLREPSIESSMLLLSAARDFPQEGTAPIQRFPISASELAAYHVVIVGDIDPRGGVLSAEQWRMLVDFVSQRGGGLALVAGERAMPARFRQTPIERLLPVRIDPAFGGRYSESLSEPFSPRLTAAGRRSALLRWASDAEDAEPTGEVALPGWYWHARVLGATPGSEVLIDHPTETTREGAMPLVVLGRFGAGRVLYQGSDDTWRWRQQRGEALYDAYWLRVVRLLGRAACLRSERRWRLEAAPRRVAVGQTARLELRAADAAAAGAAGSVAGRVRDEHGDPIDTVELVRGERGAGTFVCEYAARRAGSFSVTIDPPDDVPAGGAVTTELEAYEIDRERRQPTADPEFLRMLSARTDGRSVEADEAAGLAALVEDRSVLVPDDLVEPVWDTPAALLVFVIPVALEWVIRKWRGLA